MKEAIKRFWNDEEGATAIEYGLIAGLIAVALVTVLGLLGDGLEETFQAIIDALPVGSGGSGGNGGTSGGG